MLKNMMNKKVIELIEERIDKGKRKYKSEIDPHDGREWVQEALEEALDMTVYLAIEMIRIKEGNKYKEGLQKIQAKIAKEGILYVDVKELLNITVDYLGVDIDAIDMMDISAEGIER